MSCTTKQHWEALFDAGVVIGEGGDKGAPIEDDVGGVEIVVIKGDGTETRVEVGLAGGGELGAFDENSVDSVVVPGVSVGGGRAGPTKVEDEYCVSIVTIGTPEARGGTTVEIVLTIVVTTGVRGV